MYWHGSLDSTRRTVEKIIADRAKGILVITGIGSTHVGWRVSSRRWTPSP